MCSVSSAASAVQNPMQNLQNPMQNPTQNLQNPMQNPMQNRLANTGLPVVPDHEGVRFCRVCNGVEVGVGQNRRQASIFDLSKSLAKPWFGGAFAFYRGVQGMQGIPEFHPKISKVRLTKSKERDFGVYWCSLVLVHVTVQ